MSNIRPYFKKIWRADCDGTCSADVIVFRAFDETLAPYVYACLRQDSFFEFIMAGSKGTKMPRGDKKQMMRFPVNSRCDDVDLEAISRAVEKMGANSRENQFLSKLRDSLLPKLMSGEIDVSEVRLPTQPNNHLASPLHRPCAWDEAAVTGLPWLGSTMMLYLRVTVAQMILRYVFIKIELEYSRCTGVR